jgi:hypothetical protein
VVIPALSPRVEETLERSTAGIDRANVAPLPRIASNAGISEIGGVRRSAVLTTNDAVDLMRRIGIVFVKKAVTRLPQLASRVICRARAFAMMLMCSSCR